MTQLEPASKRYVCRACGRAHPGWVPRCTACLAWEVMIVEAPAIDPTALRLVADPADPAPLTAGLGPPAVPIPLSDVPETTYQRDATGLAPLDVVLGGGLVVGSAIVLGGEPGCGKSSLTMQAIAGLGLRVLYATGEESIAQAAGGARRIGAAIATVWIIAETDLATVLEHARTIRAQVVVIDSIQTLMCSDLAGGPGSPGQIRECTNRLVRFAKLTDTSVWLIGHVTNDGTLAGPKTLKHLVDVVLELEAGPGRDGRERILRCSGKNRFGPANVIGRFELTATGLVPVDGDGWDEPL